MRSPEYGSKIKTRARLESSLCMKSMEVIINSRVPRKFCSQIYVWKKHGDHGSMVHGSWATMGHDGQ